MERLSELIEQASNFARKAIRLERDGNIAAAIYNYSQAVKILKTLLQIDQRPQAREIYRKRLNEYSLRIKRLLSRAWSKEKQIPQVKRRTEYLVQEPSIQFTDVIMMERPKIREQDIADLEHAKQVLKEAVIWPILRPDLFKHITPWRGILLFGPPGCGKTLLAKWVASETKSTFLVVDSATLLSKWLGESEKIVKKIFSLAREHQPAVIFIDEIDAIAAKRGEEHEAMRRVKAIFLTEMDGIHSKPNEQIVVIGATNLPWDIDPAFRRRFERRVYIPLPDFNARKQIFRIHLRGIKLSDDVNFDELARLTEGYTGADIALICREAAMIPIRELAESGQLLRGKPRPVQMSDFLEAIKKIKPSVSKEEIRKYEEWARKFSTT